MQRFSIALLCCALVVALTSCAATQSANRTASTPTPVYTSSSEPGFIPAGTTIEVRTNEPIQATSAAEGRTYSAEITREIIGGNGAVLVPRGAPAQLAVAQMEQGGRLTSGQLQLGLRSISIGGRSYPVMTASEEVSGNRGLGANRRTATMVGGGAALGTLIGAIAGGGTGAAIGAATGAAAGAAVQVLTKGDQVRVPAETVLTFRLDQPLRLQGYRR